MQLKLTSIRSHPSSSPHKNSRNQIPNKYYWQTALTIFLLHPLSHVHHDAPRLPDRLPQYAEVADVAHLLFDKQQIHLARLQFADESARP